MNIGIVGCSEGRVDAYELLGRWHVERGGESEGQVCSVRVDDLDYTDLLIVLHGVGADEADRFEVETEFALPGSDLGEDQLGFVASPRSG